MKSASIFSERHVKWAYEMERRSKSGYFWIVDKAYSLRILRKLCLLVITKLEGGYFFSRSLRELLEKYHGVRVGKYSYGSCLVPGLLPRGTVIGSYCSFADGLKIFRRNHPMDVLSQHPFFYNRKLGLVSQDTINSNEDNPLIVGNDVWIGDGATILPGCKVVGDGAIIGAGAVVTRDVEAFTIVAGNPAKVVKRRFRADVEMLVVQSKWWSLALPELLGAGCLLVEKVSLESLLDFVDRLNSGRHEQSM